LIEFGGGAAKATVEDLPTGAPGAPKRPRRTAKQRLIEWGIVVVIAVVAAILLRLFVVQTFYIPSPSMSPTLKVGDRIVVSKLSYDFHGVGRGDIIVFNAPKAVASSCLTTDKVLVKRVIGLPGETISDHDGVVYINGKVLHETYLPKNDPSTYTAPFGPIHVASNNYFVMGDNRTESCDSRYWGTVTKSELIGKVEMRIWPLSRIGFF
jgi:signal peptidase I